MNQPTPTTTMPIIDFNAQHSPMGAFMSFTCGHFGAGGGIGMEIGRPADQNLSVGVKHGDRRSVAPIVCLPFTHGSAAATGNAATGNAPKSNQDRI